MKSKFARVLPDDRRAALAAVAVVGVTAAVYLPALTNGFVGLDDDVYVTANPLIASFSIANLWAILTRPYAQFYHPLTLVSFAFDHALWRLHPFGYHLADWILHLLNTALVFWICYRLVRFGKPQSSDLARTSAAIAAALFALHPLHVESVAWVAQRKDLLCALFYLMALGFYLRHAQYERQRLSRFWYRASLLAFVLALLSKSMAVTLPLVLVVADIYPLRRLRSWPGRDLSPDERGVWLEKAPFLGLAAATIIATIAAQVQGGSIRSAAEIPWSLRPWLAVHSYSFYLWKAVLPRDLTVLYPIPLQAGVHDAASWIGAGALAAITGVAWLLRRRWPVVAAAWAYYVITLAPVCGLLTFGAQSVADRYSYLPLLGPFLLAGIAVGRINQIGDHGWRPSLRALAGIAAALVWIACAHLTGRQIARWHNGETLWTDHLRIYPNDARARFSLGRFYQAQGWIGQAKLEYERSLQLEPRYFDARINLGGLLLREGNVEGAADCFRKAVEQRPNHAGARHNLGLALLRLQHPDEAAESFKQAVALDPRNPDARAGLGEALFDQGNIGAALRQYHIALSLNPRMAEVHEKLGFIYLALDQKDKARREFEQAIYLQPRSPDALIELGRLDVASSQPLQALGRLSRAAHYRPDDPEICLLKAEIFRNQGASGLAESSLRQAIELDPENVEVHVRMGLFLEEQKRYVEALEALTEAWVLLQYDEAPMSDTLAQAYRRVYEKVKTAEAKE